MIDYAAIHAELLNGWLSELADNPGDPEKPLRILLLERHADTGSGWWQTAFGPGGSGAKAVAKLLDPGTPWPLRPLESTGERREILGRTLAQTHSDLSLPAEGERLEFDRQLAQLTWGGEPLFLMMAALKASEAGIGHVLALSRTDLAIDRAKDELARIERAAPANRLDPELLGVMAAYATLCRGLDAPELREAVRAERAALDLESAADPRTVAKVLCDLLPGPEKRADPIIPDMVGEAAVLEAF